MSVIKKIKDIIICVMFLVCFGIVMTMIIASEVYPNGQSGNMVIDYLLSNITIQAMGGDDVWAQEYPYEKTSVELYVDKVDEIKKMSDSFCTVSFPGNEKINELVTMFKEDIYHYRVGEISGIFESSNYVEDEVGNVIEFRNTLEQMDVPFFYVQTPSPASVQYNQGMELQGEQLQIAERSFCMTSKLEEAGVDVINIARDYDKDIVFDSSTHWLPNDALECTRVIANHLNETYGFKIESELYDDSNFYDLMDAYPEMKESIWNNLGYNFTMPVPKCNTEYELNHANIASWKGNFLETMISTSDKWTVDGGAYHNMYQINNSIIYEVTNYNASEEKNILIIGDSFGWAVDTYLSLGVKHVTVIHNASFSGSLVNYVKQNEPDIVIMLYNDAEFYEIYTEDAYYLE